MREREGIIAQSIKSEGSLHTRRNSVFYKEILQKLETETDDKVIQEILDGLPVSMLIPHWGRKKQISHFCSLLNLVREDGFHLRPQDASEFADVVKNADIPIRRIDMAVKGKKQKLLTYYILLARHKERVKKTVNKTEGLQRFRRNPVELFCGEVSGDFPNTTALQKKRGYENVGRLFKEQGAEIGALSSVRYSEILTDCPIAIFRIRNSYFYKIDQEEELREFIAKKLRLKII